MQFTNGKLRELLSAYRKDYSTQHVLLHAIKEWKVAFDNGQHVAVVLMDLSKVFDLLWSTDCSTQIYVRDLLKKIIKFIIYVQLYL